MSTFLEFVYENTFLTLLAVGLSYSSFFQLIFCSFLGDRVKYVGPNVQSEGKKR